MNKQTPDILVLFLLVVVRGYPFWRVFRMLSWLTPTWQHHGPHREKYRPTGSSFNRYGCLNSACVHGLAIVEKKQLYPRGLLQKPACGVLVLNVGTFRRHHASPPQVGDPEFQTGSVWGVKLYVGGWNPHTPWAWNLFMFPRCSTNRSKKYIFILSI